MLLDFSMLAEVAADISALGDPIFQGETSLFINDIINNKARYKVFTVLHERKAVGFLILSTVLDEAEIFEVAVSENFRRNGLGSKLMKEVFDWCEKNGIVRIFLEVRKSNFPALAYYKKYGFIENGIRKNYYRNPADDAVLMSKVF